MCLQTLFFNLIFFIVAVILVIIAINFFTTGTHFNALHVILDEWKVV